VDNTNKYKICITTLATCFARLRRSIELIWRLEVTTLTSSPFHGSACKQKRVPPVPCKIRPLSMICTISHDHSRTRWELLLCNPLIRDSAYLPMSLWIKGNAKRLDWLHCSFLHVLLGVVDNGAGEVFSVTDYIRLRCRIRVRWCILIQCPQYNTWYSDNSNGGSYWQVLLSRATVKPPNLEWRKLTSQYQLRTSGHKRSSSRSVARAGFLKILDPYCNNN